MPRDDAIAAAAAALAAAETSRTPCAPVRVLLGVEAGIDDAYAVQRHNTHRALAAGRRLVGRKIGLTAVAVQRQLGVDQPDYGMLFADMCVADDDAIPMARLIQPKVEAEVALVLERDLDVAQPTVADLLRATAFALPALEIVDSRIADWDIRLIDTIADNASSGLFVLGGPARRLDGLDLRAITMQMRRNDEMVSSGSGADCLGNPLNAAVWLARRMVELGMPLRAGDVIMTGALGPMVPAEPGNVFTAEIAGLGTVRTRFSV